MSIQTERSGRAEKPPPLPTLRFLPGERVYYAGDPAQVALRLEAGLLRVTRPNPGGRLYTLRHILPGDVFGEEALTGGPRTGSAEALTEAVAEVIDPAQLTASACSLLTCSLAAQFRRLTAFMCHLQTGSLRERVARYLLMLARTPLAQGGPAGQPVISTTHEFLAEGTASTRESISAAITTLRAAGLVETGYGAVMLRDPVRLEQEAGASPWVQGLQRHVQVSRLGPAQISGQRLAQGGFVMRSDTDSVIVSITEKGAR